MAEFKYDVGELIRCKYCRHNRNTEEPVDCDLKIASYSEDNYCSLAEVKNMAEYKFGVGDSVVLAYPDFPEYDGRICTICSREYIREIGKNYYGVEEATGLFVEDHLIPYAQERPEELVPNVDLKTFFGGGKEHG